MSDPFLQIWNSHTDECGKPPTITNETHDKYIGFFENRFGQQWIFVYDLKQKVGELRGGDIGWATVIPVRDGKADVMLGKAEVAWLLACWIAATGIG